MAIDAISGSDLTNYINILKNTSSAEKTSEETSFSDLLNNALQGVTTTDLADKLSNEQLLSGDLDALHTTMIEAQKADLTLQLTLQIRNKIVDAYTEIMRMQV